MLFRQFGCHCGTYKTPNEKFYKYHADSLSEQWLLSDSYWTFNVFIYSISSYWLVIVWNLQFDNLSLHSAICVSFGTYSPNSMFKIWILDWEFNDYLTACLTNAHDCLMSAWKLPDNCLTTTWQLPDNCLTTAWQLTT